MEGLCLDVLNSDWHDWKTAGPGVDRLTEPQFRKDILARWQLDPALAADERAWRSLAALRARLRTAAEHLVAGGLQSADVAHLNGVLARRAWWRRLEASEGGYRLALAPVRPAAGADELLWRTAASFAETVAGEGAARLKVCANPDCRWVFYDESRNLSRRWCEAATCGNLMKVRRFRSRRREQA